MVEGDNRVPSAGKLLWDTHIPKAREGVVGAAQEDNGGLSCIEPFQDPLPLLFKLLAKSLENKPRPVKGISCLAPGETHFRTDGDERLSQLGRVVELQHLGHQFRGQFIVKCSLEIVWLSLHKGAGTVHPAWPGGQGVFDVGNKDEIGILDQKVLDKTVGLENRQAERCARLLDTGHLHSVTVYNLQPKVGKKV